MGNSIATPAGRDWFVVDWLDVWRRLGLAPADVPGVVPVAAQGAGSYHYRVHLTHLAHLGFVPGGASRFDTQPPATAGNVTLRPHQIEGIQYIRSRRGTLLADEQRVGKSAQIMYAHEPDAGPLVIVGPLAARAVWHEWAARRFGACAQEWTAHGPMQRCSVCLRVDAPVCGDSPSFVALSGRKLDEGQIKWTRRARVIFLHFAIAPAWRELFSLLPHVGTLAVDEAHLSGIQNRKGVFFESIRFLNTVAHRTIFASGTPLLNKPSGLWPMLDVLAPGAFGDFWSFARRYCDAKPGAYGWTAHGATNQPELRRRLEEVMIRRTWREISPSLPAITRTLEVVRIDASKRDEIAESVAKICVAQGGPKSVIGDLARLRRIVGAEKEIAAVEWVKARVGAEGKSCVVWTWHRDLAERVGCGFRTQYATFGPIHGEMSSDEREAVIEEARAVAKNVPVVLIATMAALGTAVNLSFATDQLMVEMDWSPHVIAQAEMRLFDGSNRVTNTILVADCDVEQRLADAIVSKLELNTQLGLQAGVGDVSSVLRESLGVEDTQTLSALADAVIAEAE